MQLRPVSWLMAAASASNADYLSVASQYKSVEFPQNRGMLGPSKWPTGIHVSDQGVSLALTQVANLPYCAHAGVELLKVCKV